MYEETALPVRSKFRVPSRSQTRIYFIQDKTKQSLFCFKWIELVACILCLCFAIIAINNVDIPVLHKLLILSSNSLGILLILAEITYTFIKRSLPVIFQVLSSGVCFTLLGLTVVTIFRIGLYHDLMKAIFFLNSSSAFIFLVDFVCRILISTYLYQTTRVRSVVDVAVSAFFPSPPASSKPKSQLHRSVLTVTPITYGGTFPIGKNQPPFLPEDRQPSIDRCHTPERGARSRNTQTQINDHKETASLNLALGSSNSGRITKSAFVQTYLLQNEKGTLTESPPFHIEEERRKKSPWTCSSATISRKYEARKQCSLSTPITYSGTFAVNKDLVPFTPDNSSDTSPKTSPRGPHGHTKPHRKHKDSKSEGHSPVRSENIFLELDKLDHISEEKLSQLSLANSSLKKSSCSFFDASVLPGSVVDENDKDFRKKLGYLMR